MGLVNLNIHPVLLLYGICAVTFGNQILSVPCSDTIPESKCAADMKVTRQAWTSFITVTLITTLGQPAIPALPANPTSTLIEMSPVSSGISSVTSNETPASSLISTSALTLESSSSTSQLATNADTAITMSSSSFSSTLANLGGAQNSSTVPAVSFPKAKRTPQQTTAIVASVVPVTVLLIILAALLRYLVIRRRQYQARLRQQGKLALSSLNDELPRTETQPRTSTTDTRSSLWGDAVRVVIRRSSLSTDLLDSRLWPIPPGHPGWLASSSKRTRRLTFFRGTSTSTVDDTTEARRWSTSSQDGSGETGSGSDSGSVWGMPGTGRSYN
ncbi:hypothetical protein F5B20DRAFT_207551 [Whalleya microplaca]|nr:hypothetical protein F5B20DRAFT_207551 [Whalleya microplaca]